MVATLGSAGPPGPVGGLQAQQCAGLVYSLNILASGAVHQLTSEAHSPLGRQPAGQAVLGARGATAWQRQQ